MVNKKKKITNNALKTQYASDVLKVSFVFFFFSLGHFRGKKENHQAILNYSSNIIITIRKPPFSHSTYSPQTLRYLSLSSISWKHGTISEEDILLKEWSFNCNSFSWGWLPSVQTSTCKIKLKLFGLFKHRFNPKF